MRTTEYTAEDYQKMIEKISSCEKEIQKRIIGQKEIVHQVLLGLFSGGNVLLEGMPGLGKTRLVSVLGKVFSLSFKRIQFTPDLMPSDITGTNIITNQREENQFTFYSGPIFANMVLADEINRATPKTQSALLEAMQEHTVTVGNTSHPLDHPFFVLATQNPIEQEGTYPLPEAQLDRFLLKILVPFPSREELMEIVRLTEDSPEPVISSILTREELLTAQKMILDIPIADAVMDYIIDLCMATHEQHKYIREGASPRAAQALIRCARAKAFLEGRYNVSFGDVEYVAYPVFRHRLLLNFDAMNDGMTEDMVIKDILSSLSKTKGVPLHD